MRYVSPKTLFICAVITVLDYEDEDFEIFFGPYIMRDTTGYVIQVIDRKTSRYPFGIIHLEDIKRDLRRVYNG